MKQGNLSLHRFFTPYSAEPVVRIFWAKAAYKIALQEGKSNPKWIQAISLVEKVKAGDAFIGKRTSQQLGLVDGKRLTWKGEMFLRESAKYCLHDGYWNSSILKRKWDVIVYPPKMTEGGRLFQYLHSNATLADKVAAAVKVLMKQEDEVDSEGGEDEIAAFEEDTSVDDTSVDVADDEDHGLGQDIKVVPSDVRIENDPRTFQEKLVDAWLLEEEAPGSSNIQELFEQLLERVVSLPSDKEYFVLTEEGEFDEQMEQNELRHSRLASIEAGFNDNSNYMDYDLDIKTWLTDEEILAEQLLTEENKKKSLWVPVADRMPIAAYYDKVLSEFQCLGMGGSRAAFLATVDKMAAGRYEAVGALLSGNLPQKPLSVA